MLRLVTVVVVAAVLALAGAALATTPAPSASAAEVTATPRPHPTVHPPRRHFEAIAAACQRARRELRGAWVRSLAAHDRHGAELILAEIRRLGGIRQRALALSSVFDEEL